MIFRFNALGGIIPDKLDFKLPPLYKYMYCIYTNV